MGIAPDFFLFVAFKDLFFDDQSYLEVLENEAIDQATTPDGGTPEKVSSYYDQFILDHGEYLRREYGVYFEEAIANSKTLCDLIVRRRAVLFEFGDDDG